MHMLFRDCDGLPVPHLPVSADGTPLTADGVRTFDLTQAVEHFKCREGTLRELFALFIHQLSPPDEPLSSLSQNSDSKLDNTSDKVRQLRIEALRRVRYPTVSAEMFEQFIEICDAKQLNPWCNQVYCRVERDPPSLSVIMGIEGIRLIAHRTGQYAGNEPVRFEMADERTPFSATATAYRTVGEGGKSKFDATVYFEEYVHHAEDDSLWRTMPRVCLDRCAEAAVLRRAFPQELGSIYVREEMQRREKARAEGMWIDRSSAQV